MKKLIIFLCLLLIPTLAFGWTVYKSDQTFTGDVDITGALSAQSATAQSILDHTTVAFWGDSLTSGANLTDGYEYPTAFSTASGYGSYNGGVSSDSSTQIKTRMIAQTGFYGYPVVIWAGYNNYSSPTTVKADIATMVAALTTEKYIILSVLNGDTVAERNTGGSYATIIQLNADLATTYGSHYLDIRAYLVSQYDPLIPADVVDFGLDVPPGSLRGDSVHPNDAGALVVANYIVSNIALLQWDNYPTLTTKNIVDIQAVGVKENGVVILTEQNPYQNLKIGSLAGELLGVGSYRNILIGREALGHGVDNQYNTAIGFEAGHNLASGDNNIAIGRSSCLGALDVNDSLCIGSDAGLASTVKVFAIGKSALAKNSTGTDNTAVGFNALETVTTGASNTAVGHNALQVNTGSINTCVGKLCLNSNTSGGYNTAIGNDAGRTNISGSWNTFIGEGAGYNGSQPNNTHHMIAIGRDAYNTKGYQAVLGSTSVTSTLLRGVVNNNVQSATCADGAGASALTLTPTTSYVQITNADTDGCDVTMGETGMIVGDRVEICIVSNAGTTVNFADTAGVSELAGVLNANIDDCITLRYGSTTTWREVSRSVN